MNPLFHEEVTPTSNDKASNSRPHEVELCIRLPNNAFSTILLQSSASIVNVKMEIQNKFGIPYEEQRLYHLRTRLDDDGTLQSYNLASGATIRVLQKTDNNMANYNNTISREYILMMKTIKAANDPLNSECTLNDNGNPNLLYPSKSCSTLENSQEPQKSLRRMEIKNDDFINSESLNGMDEKISNTELKRRIANARYSLMKENVNRDHHDILAIQRWWSSLIQVRIKGVPAAAEMIRQMKYQKMQAGEFAFQQGDFGDQFYIILTGTMAISLNGYGNVTTLGSGCLFGEFSLLKPFGDSSRTASAYADFSSPYTELVVVAKSKKTMELLNSLDQSLKKRTTLILGVPQFKNLTAPILTRLAFMSTLKFYTMRQKISSQGDMCRCLHILMEGEVKVMKKNPFSNENEEKRQITVMNLVVAPYFFGQESFEKPPLPYEVSVECVTECLVLEIPVNDVHHLIGREEPVFNHLLAMHRERRSNFDRRLENSWKNCCEATKCTTFDLNEKNLSKSDSKSLPINLAPSKRFLNLKNKELLSCAAKNRILEDIVDARFRGDRQNPKKVSLQNYWKTNEINKTTSRTSIDQESLNKRLGLVKKKDLKKTNLDGPGSKSLASLVPTQIRHVKSLQCLPSHTKFKSNQF